MGLVYGVDFGTSNSSIMVGRPNGRIVRVRNPVEASYEIPSAVCLRADGTMAVGSVATRMKLQRPAWYRDEFKRDIGNPVPHHFPPEDAGEAGRLPRERTYPVHALVAEVLGLLRRRAELEVPGTPALVVITVPAAWRAGNRELMLAAAEQAGFVPGTVHLITEPAAAAAYAAREQLGLRERALLVYDLGGGTFDCALVRGGRGGFEVVGESGGLDDIGGILFDRQILDLIRTRHPEQTRELLDGPPPDVPTLARRLQLRDTCENIKRVLASEKRYEGLLTELGSGARFALTREELTVRLAPLVEETLDECERLLRAQGMGWSDIDGVVAVGGSVRLPMVGEMIARRAGSGRASVQRVDDPELAVAHGAVLHAFRLRADERPPDPARAASGPRIAPETAPEPVPAPKDEETATPAPSPSPTATGGPIPTTEATAGPSTAPDPAATARPAAEHAAGPRVESEAPRRDASTPPTVFRARDAARLRSARRWNRVAGLFIVLMCTALLLYLTGAASAVGIAKAPASRYLSYAVIGSALLNALALLRLAAILRRMLRHSGATVACSLAMAGIASLQYQIGGWMTPALIVPLLLYQAVWIDGLPGKGTFVTELYVGARGLSFAFDGGRRTILLPWTTVDRFFVAGEGLDRSLCVRLRSAPPGRWPFPKLPQADDAAGQATGGPGVGAAEAGAPVEYRLFDRRHFSSQEAVIERLQAVDAARFDRSA